MKNLLTCLFLALSFISFSQSKEKKKVDPKYFYCYRDTSFETDDYKIYLEDAIAIDTYSKLRVRIFNKTNDYLIFKPNDVVFKINGQDLISKDKQLIIPPNDEDNKVIDVKGKGLQADNYELEVKTLYKVAANVPAINVEEFAIPLSRNDISAGGFKCSVKKPDIQTNKSVFKIGCQYSGDGIGILDPKKIVAIMPKGQENENASRDKPVLLEKGKVENFNVVIKEIKGAGDMQKEPFKLKFNDTFKDSKVTQIRGGKIILGLDAKKTGEKNQ